MRDREANKPHGLSKQICGCGNLRLEKQTQVENQSSDLAMLGWMSSQLNLLLRPKYKCESYQLL